MTIRLEINLLDWDEWNREQIARHGMIPEDVEATINHVMLVKPSYKERFMVICAHPKGHVLTVIVGDSPHEPGTFYVFSARHAHRKERRDALQEREI